MYASEFESSNGAIALRFATGLILEGKKNREKKVRISETKTEHDRERMNARSRCTFASLHSLDSLFNNNGQSRRERNPNHAAVKCSTKSC